MPINSDMGADLKLSAFSQLQFFGSPPLIPPWAAVGKVSSGREEGEAFIASSTAAIREADIIAAFANEWIAAL
jgi:hypothetical protein